MEVCRREGFSFIGDVFFLGLTLSCPLFPFGVDPSPCSSGLLGVINEAAEGAAQRAVWPRDGQELLVEGVALGISVVCLLDGGEGGLLNEERHIAK